MDRAEPLRILFSAPAYWPAEAFGGPVWMARGLNSEAVRRGHSVRVLTTGLRDLTHGGSFRTRTAEVDGAEVVYLATPVRYRWMGITPSLPWWLSPSRRVDVAHVFGFRDPIGTAVAAWCAARSIPYVFEPLGMFLPRLRKVHLKRALDSSLFRTVHRRAASIVVTSEHERRQVLSAGASPARVVVRGNGFPDPGEMPAVSGLLRSVLRVDEADRVVLYVGRIADGKGIEFLLAHAEQRPDVHLALVGPDDRHDVSRLVDAALTNPATAGRIHRLEPSSRPLAFYGDADLLVLPSASESFGMVAAEAAAAGTPVVVTDRCGVAEWLGGAAVVVPYDARAVSHAIDRVLSDHLLRGRLSAEGPKVARRNSWRVMAQRQEEIYRAAISRG